METTFEKAKVGDKVWDFVWGWGIVSCVGAEITYPIYVTFPVTKLQYSNGGSSYCLANRTLFWDELKIEPPPRPKRNVKKVGWVHRNFIMSGYSANTVRVEYEIEE